MPKTFVGLTMGSFALQSKLRVLGAESTLLASFNSLSRTVECSTSCFDSYYRKETNLNLKFVFCFSRLLVSLACEPMNERTNERMASACRPSAELPNLVTFQRATRLGASGTLMHTELRMVSKTGRIFKVSFDGFLI